MISIIEIKLTITKNDLVVKCMQSHVVSRADMSSDSQSPVPAPRLRLELHLIILMINYSKLILFNLFLNDKSSQNNSELLLSNCATRTEFLIQIRTLLG